MIDQAPVGRRLPVGQAQVVQDVVASGRVLDVLVGAAGTGKSTTMAGVREVWEGHYGPGSVIGLAPSAAAAEVLSQVAGIPSENTAKWLTENARNVLRFEQIGELQARLRRASPSLGTRAATGKLRALIGEYRHWSLRPGRLIIVDEASMAGTFDLDTLTTQAWQAGAKVPLVGDWGQLSPVTAGGAFSLLVNDRDDAPNCSMYAGSPTSGNGRRPWGCATAWLASWTPTTPTVGSAAAGAKPCWAPYMAGGAPTSPLEGGR